MRGSETLVATAGAIAVSVDPSLAVPAVATIITALITGLGAWAVSKAQHRGKPENALIDQLQETMQDRDEFYKGQIADIKATAQDANDRAGRAEDSAKRNERRNLALLSYAHRLRDHIERRLDPPAPDWPPEVNKED